jgi:pyruvate/2-oxoglutarate dehydrogenase complex dihydrolipoamide acyltransferase (E2) component
MQIHVVAPKTSLTAKEVIVTEWRKKVGDRINADEVLLTVETEKATVEVLAPADGVLFSILVAAGETVEVSSVLAIIDAEG